MREITKNTVCDLIFKTLDHEKYLMELYEGDKELYNFHFGQVVALKQLYRDLTGQSPREGYKEYVKRNGKKINV